VRCRCETRKPEWVEILIPHQKDPPQLFMMYFHPPSSSWGGYPSTRNLVCCQAIVSGITRNEHLLRFQYRFFGGMILKNQFHARPFDFLDVISTPESGSLFFSRRINVFSSPAVVLFSWDLVPRQVGGVSSFPRRSCREFWGLLPARGTIYTHGGIKRKQFKGSMHLPTLWKDGCNQTDSMERSEILWA
jgi:hypothetical protein